MAKRNYNKINETIDILNAQYHRLERHVEDLRKEVEAQNLRIEQALRDFNAYLNIFKSFYESTNIATNLYLDKYRN